MLQTQVQCKTPTCSLCYRHRCSVRPLLAPCAHVTVSLQDWRRRLADKDGEVERLTEQLHKSDTQLRQREDALQVECLLCVSAGVLNECHLGLVHQRTLQKYWSIWIILKYSKEFKSPSQVCSLRHIVSHLLYRIIQM